MHPFMKYVEVNAQEVEELLTDENWFMEQKLDGTRVTVVVYEDRIEYYSVFKGSPWAKNITIAQHLHLFEEELHDMCRGADFGTRAVFEGELLTGTGHLHLFDLLEFHQRSRHVEVSMSWSCYARTMELLDMSLQRGPEVNRVHVARISAGRDKRKALENLKERGVEGVIFKHMDGPYMPGKRVDFVRKYKFVKSAEVVVMERVQEPNAAVFGCYDSEGALVKVGRCSMIGKPEVIPGDIIEINYLYWTGDAVYQPRMMRKRWDKAAQDCSIDQFAPYSREVI